MVRSSRQQLALRFTQQAQSSGVQAMRACHIQGFQFHCSESFLLKLDLQHRANIDSSPKGVFAAGKAGERESSHSTEHSKAFIVHVIGVSVFQYSENQPLVGRLRSGGLP